MTHVPRYLRPTSKMDFTDWLVLLTIEGTFLGLIVAGILLTKTAYSGG